MDSAGGGIVQTEGVSMSGGSYDYLYAKVDEAASQIVGREASTLRRAFAEHLKLVSAALHAIEWNDSGDGAPDESKLIQACLPKGAELKQAIADAKVARTALDSVIKKAGKK